MSIWIFLDNEGPQTLNDNAQENTVALAEKCGLGKKSGSAFYKRLSVVDDIWGDFHQVAKDPDYSSGHTLKVILPFYKAMGATSQWLYDFAKENLRVVPNIDSVLANLDNKYNVRMISTSYEFFIRAFCDRVGFDFAKTRCTFVEGFDEIPVSQKEKKALLAFMEEVAKMPVIEYDETTGAVVPEHRAHYDRFSEFIWEMVYNMPTGEFLRKIHPLGQTQKREAVEEICRQFKVSKKNVMYVGDSQTDLQCVEWLRGKGLIMMFNGKGRVCGLSDLMYIGEDAKVIETVANHFCELGRSGVIDRYTIYYKLPEAGQGQANLLAAVTPENIKELEARSVKERKEFRGISIGELT